ncbi:MAG: DISARM system phospholipase D-like protein DrmC [Candidatus Sericytochromatia bacterium]
MIKEIFISLPIHLRERLIKALDTNVISPPYSNAQLKAIIGTQQETENLLNALLELEKLGFQGSSAALWIRTLEQARASMPQPELVWSGPEVPGVYARNTRQVYEALFQAANQSIWISSYTYYDGKNTFDILARRMDDNPNMKVTMLLNIKRNQGNCDSETELIRKYATHFWKRNWPGKNQPQVYYDPRSLNLDKPEGVLHAKAVVVDLESVFITSANLTEAAYDRNIELGMVIKDKSLAASIVSHFQTLIDRKLLRILPKY